MNITELMPELDDGKTITHAGKDWEMSFIKETRYIEIKQAGTVLNLEAGIADFPSTGWELKIA